MTSNPTIPQDMPPASPRRFGAMDATRLLIALAGLGVATFLAVESSTASALPGCGSGSACASVLNSPWSRWLGIPVAIPAAAIWLVAVIASAARRKPLLIFCGLMLGGAGVWFTFVQSALIGQICPYCIAAHVLGMAMLVVAVVGLTHLPIKSLIGAMAIVLALIVGQVVFPSQVAARHRLLQFHSFEINVGRLPMLGDPDAPHVALLLFDYTCPHCRQLHAFLHDAVARYDGQLAVALAPAPMDAACNPHYDRTEAQHARACALARAMVAVWLADERQLDAMDRYLWDRGPADNWADYQTTAERLVGARNFEQSLLNPAVGSIIEGGCRLNHALGEASGTGDILPKLVLGTENNDMIVGRPGTAVELFADLESMLGLQPIESASP